MQSGRAKAQESVRVCDEMEACCAVHWVATGQGWGEAAAHRQTGRWDTLTHALTQIAPEVECIR